MAKFTVVFFFFAAVRMMEHLDTEGVVEFKRSEHKLLKSRAAQTAEKLRNHPDRIRPAQSDKGRVGAW